MNGVNITYVSDLHVEFSEIMPEQADKVLKGGDVFVLAGDIFPIKWLPKAKHLQNFLDTASRRYDKVYAVSGNHEPYGRSLSDMSMLKDFYSGHGITYLDDEYDDFQGLRFFGGVLWPDMNKDDPLTKEVVRNYLNDYRVIEGMTPDEAVRRHHRTMDALRACEPDVVVTHMAPHRNSVHPRFEKEGLANYGYYSEVDIPPYVKLWIHGHVHDSFYYGVGRTHVTCNPRGYPHETSRNGFTWNASARIIGGRAYRTTDLLESN
jgi:Icc-related predicted phosphoesterase